LLEERIEEVRTIQIPLPAHPSHLEIDAHSEDESQPSLLETPHVNIWFQESGIGLRDGLCTTTVDREDNCW